MLVGQQMLLTVNCHASQVGADRRSFAAVRMTLGALRLEDKLARYRVATGTT